MKKIILSFLLLSFLISSAYAAENDTAYVQVDIKNNQLTVNGIIETNVVGIGRVNVSAGFLNFNDTLSANPINCQDVNVNGTTYQTNCSLNIDFTKTLPLKFENLVSVTATEGDLQTRYEDCNFQRANYLAAYTTCESQRVKLDGVESNYSSCQTNLASCNNERGNLQTEKNTLQTQVTENENKPITWVIIGVIAGIVGVFFYQGKIGGPKARSPEDSYNTTGAS